jgi:hypothetical protein
LYGAEARASRRHTLELKTTVGIRRFCRARNSC